MKILLSFFLFACFIAGCSEATKPATDEATAKDTKKSAVNDPQPKRVSDKTADSLVSALTWLENNPKTKMWSILLKRSKWAKDVHHGYYTVLAPDDDVLKKAGVDLLSELKYPENQSLLDKMMARHIIKTPLTITKTVGMKSLECIDGSNLDFQPGVQQIEGIYYELYQYGTFHGSVVPINGIIDLPARQLERLVDKRKQGKSSAKAS